MMAATMDREFARPLALFYIATALAKAGDVAGAKLLTETIEVDYRRAEAQCAIAMVQARASDIPGAEATAAIVVGKDDIKQKAILAIALAKARAGDFGGANLALSQAKAFTADIEDGRAKAEALSVIAAFQANTGDSASAKETFDQAKAAAETAMNIGRFRAFSSIAVAQARTGDLNEAKATAALITSRLSIGVETLCEIAAARAWLEGPASAEIWARAQATPESRCYAHLGVAKTAAAQSRGQLTPGVNEDED